MNWKSEYFIPFIGGYYLIRDILDGSFFATDQPSPKAQEVQFPTSENERVIPEVFGTVRVAPNLIAVGDVKSKKIKEDGITVGRAYFAAQLWACCTGCDSFSFFYRDNKLVSTAVANSNGATLDIKTGKTSPENGSGIGRRPVYFYLGDQTSIDSQLASDVGIGTTNYKGVAMFGMRRKGNGFIGDNVSRFPSYSVRCRRTDLGVSDVVGDGVDRIDGFYQDSVNPAVAAYYLLKQIHDESIIDAASFDAVATTLYNETLGVSFAADGSRQIGEYITEIARHMDGFIWWSIRDGKYKCKLMRDDYKTGDNSIDDLNTYDETHVRNVEFQRPDISEMFTEVNYKYTFPPKNEPDVILVKSPANRASMGGRDRKRDAEFFWYDDVDYLRQQMERSNIRHFIPRARVEFEIHESDFSEDKGDVFVWDYEPLGITGMILRVTDLQPRSEKDSTVFYVSAEEDVYSVGEASVETITIDDPPENDVILENAITDYTIRECTPEQASELSIQVLAASPSASDIVDGVYVQVADLDVQEVDPIPLGTLSAGVSAGDAVSRTATITVTGAFFSAITNTDQQWQRGNTIILIEDGTTEEFVSVRTITATGNPNEYDLTGLIRGVGGTEIETHLSSANVWLLDEGIRQNVISVAGVSPIDMDITITPKNYAEIGPETTDTYTYQFGCETPYALRDLEETRQVGQVTFSYHLAVAGRTFFDIDAQPATSTRIPASYQYVADYLDDGLAFSISDLPNYTPTTIGYVSGSTVAGDDWAFYAVNNGRFSDKVTITTAGPLP